MLILITLLIATTAGHRVTESLEDLPPDAFKNTTTLYPVSNTTNDSKEKTSASQEKTKISSDATTWKLEAAFAESNFDKMAANSSATETERVEQENKTKNASEEFKPSPHLGTFFEDDSLELTPTKATFGDFRPMKKPASGFISFPKDKYKASFYSPPKDIFRQNEFPYKIEGSILTRAKNSWRPDSMVSRPTMEVPMRVPAGGLYKAPVQDAFTEKPDDEDFGLSFHDLKENNHNSVDVKKRVNPWKNLLRLITAFIPVGLIISALTPNIITVESTGPDSQYPGPHQVFRRSDNSLSQLSPISEPCRRRLLCELHSENNYSTQVQQGRVRRRHCHRIHCEEPEALARMLQWLLNHHTNDQQGQHKT